MKKYFISAVVVAAILFSGSCKEKASKVLTQDVVFKKEGELLLKKIANDSTIARLNIEIADDEYQTQTGLMYRKSMKDDQAMLFIFEDEIQRAFYMKNTQFALDIIFINSDRKIVNIQKNAKSLDLTSLPSEGPAQYVLEVNAGLSDVWTLESGDIVEWQ
jgi:uncharacterized membrane protein (UPF0127 family)